jgi:hypothetical protein
MESNIMERHDQASDEVVKQTRPNYHFKPGNEYGKGRPKGSINKLTVKALLAELSDTVGKPYEQQLAENYREAIVAQDRKLIHAYDNLFLSKLLADKVDLTVDTNMEQLDAKREAFMGALQAYGQAVELEVKLVNPNHNKTTMDITMDPGWATVEHNNHNNQDSQDTDEAHQDARGDDDTSR